MQTLSSWENCTQIDTRRVCVSMVRNTALSWWEGIQVLLFRCPWKRLTVFNPSWGQLPTSPNSCSFFQLCCHVQPLSPCWTLYDVMPWTLTPCSAPVLEICCSWENLLEVTQGNFFMVWFARSGSFRSEGSVSPARNNTDNKKKTSKNV